MQKIAMQILLKLSKTVQRQTVLFSGDMINEHISSLSEEKWKVFDVLHRCSKDFIKTLGLKDHRL